MISRRERNYLKRLSVAGKLQEQTPDLFEEVEAQNRRRSHLILIIQRKARQLKIDAPPDLETKNETELESIRFSLSKQIARSKMSAPTEEVAA